MQPTRFRIVTFNIRFGTSEDGPNSWPYRREALIKLLQEIDADIICLQEALKFQTEEIALALTEHSWVGVGRENGQEDGEFEPIFYRKAFGDPESSGTFWLSPTPDEPGTKGWNAANTRICTWASWGESRVFNVHLDHESEKARIESVSLVISRIREDKAPTLLCGDFNAEPESTPVRVLLSQGFMDFAADSGDTFNAFDPGSSRNVRIDYVFGLGVDPPTECAVAREPLVSDHWPVVITWNTSRRNADSDLNRFKRQKSLPIVFIMIVAGALGAALFQKNGFGMVVFVEFLVLVTFGSMLLRIYRM